MLGVMLTLAMLAAMWPSAYAANAEQNAYGHTVAYSPVKSLYATYNTNFQTGVQRALKLFNATVSQWNGVPANTRKMAASAKTWLNSNQYLLNQFGRYNYARTSGHWNSAHRDHQFSGTIDSIDGMHQYNVYYDFNTLRTGSSGGNITNMLNKGDVEYFFTTGLKTVQTSWFVFGKSNDWADLWFMGQHWNKGGDGWHDINWNGGSGPAFSDDSAWKASSNMGELHFKAESDRDKEIDAYMGWGILVGRDIAGPRIKSVSVTSDIAGKKPLSGGITLGNLGTLTDRTVYFQVTWDEPVLFSGLTSAQIASLQLDIQTSGIDGMSGMPARASLLRFAPSPTDATPVMTFEYRIPDPYTDSSQVTQERGYYYKFSKISVSGSDNKAVWNSLYDISGNKFAANRNGQQPSGKVEYSIAGSPTVDLLPFAVNNLRTSKSETPEKVFIQSGETVNVTLELNKTLTPSGGAPAVTLNVKDNSKAGEYVRLEPVKTSTARVNGALGGMGSVLSYRLVLDSAKHTVDDPGSIVKVTSITPAGNSKDSSGYTLMTYAQNGDGALAPTNLPAAASGKLTQYIKSPDKQYKLDFEPPEVAVTVSDAGGGVIMVKAAVTDTNLEGSDAAFTIAISGRTDGVTQLQSSTTEGYDGSAWRDAAAGNPISSSAPMIGPGDTKYAYVFIKLPVAGTEVNEVKATVTLTDEAGNQASATGKLPQEGQSWPGVDNLAPAVTLTKAVESAGAYAGRDEYAKVAVSDMSVTNWVYTWQDTYDSEGGSTRLAAPDLSAAVAGSGAAAHFPDPGSLTGNKVHYKTLWVQAADSMGNTSEPVSMDFGFNRTYAEVNIIYADTSAQYTSGSYPSVGVEIKNVENYWYAWVERPANYISEAGTDYGDLATYFKNQGGMSSTGVRNFAAMGTPDSDTEGSPLENTTQLTIALSSSTKVARHGESGLYPYDTKWAYSGAGIDTVAEAVYANDTTRPVALLLWGQGEYGDLIYKAVEFDTFYKEPASIEVRHEGFSSNDNTGRRVDNTREVRASGSMGSASKGLYWPSDYDDPQYYGSDDAGAFFNLRSIHGFAEAQFYLSGDPLTGLDRVDLNHSVITLEQVQYENLDGEWASESNTTARKELVQWRLSDLAPHPVPDPRYIKDGNMTWYTNYNTVGMGEYFSNFYKATLSFDPAVIEAVPFVQVGYDEASGLPEYRNVRYEFKVRLAYKNGAAGEESLLSYWIFDNGAPAQASLYAVMDEAGHYIRESENGGDPASAPVAVVFDSEGNDVTTNVPVITFGDSAGGGITHPKIQFAASEWPYSFGAEYRATHTSKYANPPVPLGVGLKVRYGTAAGSLASTAVFGQSQSYEDNYMEYGAWGHTIPVSPGAFPEHGSEITLYYQFYDEIQGGESPIYVVKLRRDDKPPVVELSVSETEAPQRGVAVKLDAVYDVHEVSSGDGMAYVIDTPSSSIDVFVNAWRKIYPGEAFNTSDPDGDEYYHPDEDFLDKDYDNAADHVRVKPDENGVYNFVGNGYLSADAFDTAGNFTTSLLVNGEEYVSPPGSEGAVYLVENIDRDPPEFIAEPVWNADAAAGSFTLSATVDASAASAYIRFDKDYSEFLAGVDYDAHTVAMEGDDPATEAVEDGYHITIPASEPPLYALASAPGRFGGGFDPVAGAVNLTAYAKYDVNGTAKLASATLIVVDSAGNAVERQYDFAGGLAGIKPSITNANTGIAQNVSNYPVYTHGGTLDFTAPIKLDHYRTDFAASHGHLPIYADGPASISYTDLFGASYTENIYANIFGPAFAHSLTFHVGETVIDPTVPTNQNVTVKVDTGGTPDLTVGSGTAWEATLSENGTVAYSLTNSSLGQSKSFTLPVINIDKTAPTAVVNASINSAAYEVTDAETGETAVETHLYSITYEICGFDESGVTMIGDDGSTAPASITFDSSSPGKTYTFRFRDAAGNEGMYTADVSDIVFHDPADSVIAGYRLTYNASGTNGPNSMGTYTSGGSTLSLGLANSDVVVRAEALNAAGEVVPAVFAVSGGLPAGAVAFAASRSVLFTGEDAENRTVTAALTGPGDGNAITVPVILPGGTIDKTAPTGTVHYVDVEGAGGVKAYLVPLSADIPEDGIAVTGHRSDGTALVLTKDGDGYYVEFDENGSGHFLLRDNAGNTGTVAIAVQSIDASAPVLGPEGWSADSEASSKAATWTRDLARILNTPTNNSIKAFFSFNEQLSRVEVTAYDRKDGNVLTPADSYVTAIVSGNNVTIEFLRNCQAKIVVYDLRGNAITLWRPEDGPVTVIDKEAPELLSGYPQKTVTGNTAALTYAFKNDESVMLLSDPDSGYKNSHTVEFTDNGQYVLTFADRAGNVLSAFPAINELDALAPHVKLSQDFVGDGSEHGGMGPDGKAFYYTNRNVRILLNITDETQEGMTVTAKRLGGAAVQVKQETVSQTAGNATKTYNYTVTVAENGVYEITAKDKWGHENIINTSITLIDRTPPAIKMESTKAVSVERNANADAVKLGVLQGVAATDFGAGKAIDGVTLSADISAVDLANAGSYAVVITAADPLGNTAVKTRIVNVRNEGVRLFTVNGQAVEENDVYSTSPATVTVAVSDLSFGGEKAALYYARGYKTAAQMKYAEHFDGAAGFAASEKGYYTIMAQSAERGMYLVYVYVY
jgi:hypothetical protein